MQGNCHRTNQPCTQPGTYSVFESQVSTSRAHCQHDKPLLILWLCLKAAASQHANLQLAFLASHTPLLSSGLMQQDMDEAVLGAAAVTDANSPHWLVMTPSQVLHLPMGQNQPARSAPASARQGAAPRRPAVSQAVSQLTGKMLCLLEAAMQDTLQCCCRGLLLPLTTSTCQCALADTASAIKAVAELHAPAGTSRPLQVFQPGSATCVAQSLPNAQEPFVLPIVKSVFPQLRLP